MGNYQRRELRRAPCIKKGYPVVKMESYEGRKEPDMTTRYRRQHVSSTCSVLSRSGVAAVIAGVRVGMARGMVGWPTCVGTARVPNIYCSFLDGMTTTAVRNTSVDGMLVVKATAGRVQLNKLVAHDEGGDAWSLRMSRRSLEWAAGVAAEMAAETEQKSNKSEASCAYRTNCVTRVLMPSSMACHGCWFGTIR